MAKIVSPYSFLLLSITIPLVLLATTSAHQFTVGGPMNWTVPSGQDSDFYNLWAADNRFHVGDFLYFTYESDSVLLVTRNDYTQCNTSNPIFAFRDGQTQFRLDRYGFFFFVSGEPGHCNAGQRMIVRVMVHPDGDFESPPAMSPGAYAPGPSTDEPALSPASPPTGLVPSPHPRNSRGLKLSPFVWVFAVLLGVLFVVVCLI